MSYLNLGGVSGDCRLGAVSGNVFEGFICLCHDLGFVVFLYISHVNTFLYYSGTSILASGIAGCGCCWCFCFRCDIRHVSTLSFGNGDMGPLVRCMGLNVGHGLQFGTMGNHDSRPEQLLGAAPPCRYGTQHRHDSGGRLTAHVCTPTTCEVYWDDPRDVWNPIGATTPSCDASSDFNMRALRMTEVAVTPSFNQHRFLKGDRQCSTAFE